MSPLAIEPNATNPCHASAMRWAPNLISNSCVHHTTPPMEPTPVSSSLSASRGPPASSQGRNVGHCKCLWLANLPRSPDGARVQQLLPRGGKEGLGVPGSLKLLLFQSSVCREKWTSALRERTVPWRPPSFVQHAPPPRPTHYPAAYPLQILLCPSPHNLASNILSPALLHLAPRHCRLLARPRCNRVLFFSQLPLHSDLGFFNLLR